MQEDAWMCVSTWRRSARKVVTAVRPRLHPCGPVTSADLPYVVEVSVRNLLLSRQLLHLIQEDVHLKLGAQVLKAAVAERLPVKVIHGRSETFFSLQTLG